MSKEGHTATGKADTLSVANYVVAFVDLLGQRAELHGEGLLPDVADEQVKARLISKVRATVGSIVALQERSTAMMAAMHAREDDALRQSLPLDRRAIWDDVRRPIVKSQYWSDGLVCYCPAADELARCPMTGVFEVLSLAGTLCFIGLASERPLRGGIEIAWGVELGTEGLYGAAVARAYELESQVADYPRIVVGPRLVEYMRAQAAGSPADPYSQVNWQMARVCSSMLMVDDDGHHVVNYLGAGFRQAVTAPSYEALYEKAYSYVRAQLHQHRSTRDTKLAFRYTRLERYFNGHPASSGSSLPNAW